MAWDNRSNNQKKRRKRFRKWGFTFFGETPQFRQEENIAEFGQELTKSEPAAQASFPLVMAKVGDRVRIVRIRGKAGRSRLLSLGLTPGTELLMLSHVPGGSVIVAFQDKRIGLGASMAHKILVIDTFDYVSTSREVELMNRETNTYLCNLPVGCRGRVVGYELVTGGYKGRLLAMGLTPGTEFTVIHYAPLDDLIQVEVRGFVLSLRKHEADVLCIEEVSDEQKQ
jgi:ferrous iron transport protein A